MNPIGRMCEIDVVFGGRWDDLKEEARHKCVHQGVTGYYDVKELDQGLVPAPLAAFQAANPDDPAAAHAVFYCDEDGLIFGSVIFSGGQIAPMSEVVHEDEESWLRAVAIALEDSNLDTVHIPIGVEVHISDRIRKYDLSSPADGKALPSLSPASGSKAILGLAVIALVLAGIGGGTWAFLTGKFEPPPPEIEMMTEKRVPLFGEVLDACAEDLASPWPAPPEWELSREGCVSDWQTAQITGLAPADQVPHAYRLYTIDQQTWDPYLSRLSFLRISERFKGQVVEGTGQFLLYIPYDLQTELVDNAYLPDPDPQEIVRSKFIGAIRIQGGTGMETLSASTELELDVVLSRLSGERLTPAHVFHDMSGGTTGFRFGPERVETRQVRVN